MNVSHHKFRRKKNNISNYFPPIFVGPTSIKKIQKEKEKHLWEYQVLSGLLKKATMYDKKRTSRGLKSELSGESSDLSEDSDEEVEDEVSPSRRIEHPTTMGTNAGDYYSTVTKYYPIIKINIM